MPRLGFSGSGANCSFFCRHPVWFCRSGTTSGPPAQEVPTTPGEDRVVVPSPRVVPGWENRTGTGQNDHFGALPGKLRKLALGTASWSCCEAIRRMREGV